MTRNCRVMSLVLGGLLCPLVASEGFSLEILPSRRPSGESKPVLERDSTFHSLMTAVGGEGTMPEKGLTPWVIGASVQVTTDNSDTGFAPVIEAQTPEPFFAYKKTKGGEHYLSLNGKLTLRPEPSAGDTEDVANTIRLDTGVATLDAVARYMLAWGTQYALDVRFTPHFSYQSAKTTPEDGSASSGIQKSEFGIMTPDLTAGLWLKYLYLGYKYRYYRSFGGETGDAIAEDINKSHSHTLVAVVPLTTNAQDPAKVDWYIEVKYATGKGDGGAFGLALSRVFPQL